MKVNRQELVKIAGYLGAAFLVAGYIRYSVQGILGTWEKVLLAVGGVLLLFSLAVNYKQIIAYFGTRSGRLGTNTALLTLAVVVILAIVNFLGYRHHKRIDLTSEQLYSLSDQTKKIVSGLQKDVKVIKFAPPGDDQANQLRDQMVEYRDLSRRLTYEQVDPIARPEIARQYKIQQMGDIIVTSGERVERVQGTGEQELTNAILKVTRDSLKTVCFTEGHGEKSLTGTDAEGFANVEKVLKNENYETKSVNLLSENQVPADCAVLIVAGPKRPLIASETAAIGKYLDAGGKALLLLDPDTDPQVEEVLKAWNIELGNNIILDRYTIRGGAATIPTIFNWGAHPITDRFGSEWSLHALARSVKPGTASGSGVSTSTIMSTSELGWAETELKDGSEPVFDEGKDLKGPVSIGVAASKAAADKEARLVVIGDSDFAGNQLLAAGRNKDLLMNSINWLAQDEDLISIRPKSQTNRRVDLTESQQNLLFWLLIAVMPVAVIGSGAYIWWKRR